jgi:hypothetical protein
MTGLLPAGDNRLSDLAGRIRDASEAMNAASHEAAERALEAGALLIEAKAECGHGDWLPFLERAGLHERQAQRLMRLAGSGLKSDTVSDLGIRGALDLIAKRRLPVNGAVLQVSTPLEDGRYGGTAWVWESEQQEGFYHTAGAAADFASYYATKRPLDNTRSQFSFRYVDEILGQRHGAMQFASLAIDRGLCELFRVAALGEDVGGASPAFFRLIVEARGGGAQ